jgi:hypothetical protein
MSWSLTVLPLHEVARDGGLEWAAGAEFSRGVPDEAPQAQPLPRAGDVLGALRAVGGLELDEIGLHAAGQVSHDQSLPGGAAVEGLSFRKPSGVAALRAVCALTALAGPLLVYDDSADQVFVVWPGERAEDLADDWPW